GGRQAAPDRRSAFTRMLGADHRLTGHPHTCGIEMQRHGRDLVVGDVVVANLAASTAAEEARLWKHVPQLMVSRAAGKCLARAKKQHELGRDVLSRAAPAISRSPR